MDDKTINNNNDYFDLRFFSKNNYVGKKKRNRQTKKAKYFLILKIQRDIKIINDSMGYFTPRIKNLHYFLK